MAIHIHNVSDAFILLVGMHTDTRISAKNVSLLVMTYRVVRIIRVIRSDNFLLAVSYKKRFLQLFKSFLKITIASVSMFCQSTKSAQDYTTYMAIPIQSVSDNFIILDIKFWDPKNEV